MLNVEKSNKIQFLVLHVKIIFRKSLVKFSFNVLIPGLVVCTRAQLLEMVGGTRQCIFNCHQSHFVCRSAQSMGVKRGDKDKCSLQQGI